MNGNSILQSILCLITDARYITIVIYIYIYIYIYIGESLRLPTTSRISVTI